MEINEKNGVNKKLVLYVILREIIILMLIIFTIIMMACLFYKDSKVIIPIIFLIIGIVTLIISSNKIKIGMKNIETNSKNDMIRRDKLLQVLTIQIISIIIIAFWLCIVFALAGLAESKDSKAIIDMVKIVLYVTFINIPRNTIYCCDDYKNCI